MEAFFVSIILIGILVVCFALVWMVIEKKRAMDYRLEIDERRYELMQIIEDADQLLTEMNNFSSYIVDQMEEKQQSIEFSLHKAEQRIEQLFDNMYIKPVHVPEMLDVTKEIKEQTEKIINNKEIKNEVNSEIEENIEIEESILSSRKKGKLIPFDERKREVIKLHKKGISSTEIAKMLDMGKGEIELISRMCQ
jgi:ElaB/YqjD/DUF883 family membrane-anchored ribosome-binding protein